jgi:signal transduction histidine kinase
VTERIVHVVTEAITNAVRHGAAQQISVDLGTQNEAVTITVTDDGFGPRQGKPGTGSHYLGLVAPQAWSLQPAPDGGSQLTVRITR